MIKKNVEIDIIMAQHVLDALVDYGVLDRKAADDPKIIGIVTATIRIDRFGGLDPRLKAAKSKRARKK
jgi:hypothetical protein